MLAVTAGRVEPWHADPVTLFDDRNAHADSRDTANGLVPRNERKFWLQGPVPGRGVKVRVAHTTRFRFHQYLARAGRGNIPLLKQQRFAELLDNGDVHSSGHLGDSF